LLGPVFPNPFRGSLNVSFSLARPVRATVVVYDLAGRAVRHLDDGMREAGTHVLTWDGRLDAGSQAPAGLYLVRFQAGEVRQTRRVQLIR
jgi:flagellar hook assembly protein FlgD